MPDDPRPAHRPGPSRRPIAVRTWAIFRKMAGLLAARHVTANAISVAGMVCGIAAGGALAATAHLADGHCLSAWLGAVAFILLRLWANMLDGMVAVEWGRASAVGELYNEVPDRVSDAAVLIGAGYASGGDVALGWAAACTAVFVAYVRTIGKAAGAPQEFCGPMAKQQRMFTIVAAALYCGLAPDESQFADASGRGPISAALLLIVVLGLTTAVRRLRRIAANLNTGKP